ncbi:MAG: thiamine pyrophosphate-dependent enzyme, partial [Dehalococcoidia bacterium]
MRKAMVAKTDKATRLTGEKLLAMYQKMLEVRRFEEKAIELFGKNLIWGTIHPCIGQEAVAVGICSALEPSDYITSTHRGHGHCIAKGAELGPMMAELLARD